MKKIDPIFLRNGQSWVQWHMPVFPAPGGGGRALKFQASLEPHSEDPDFKNKLK